MRRFAFLLAIALVVGAGPTPGAAEEEKPVYLDLTGARVLASPGWPAALEGFLPPGRAVEPLVLPVVPQGPTLVLGLWDSDPAARELARLLGVVAGRGLRGGYLVDVRLSQRHPLVVILGQDAAALAAARFELETFMPEARAGAARSLDMTKPDEQGGVRIRLENPAPHLRLVRPRYRIRALGGIEEQGSPFDAASAHANRLWLESGRPPMVGRPGSFARLNEHGVEPVAWAEVPSTYLGPGLPQLGFQRTSVLRASGVAGSTLAAPQRLVARAEGALDGLLAWQAKGVRHFALHLTPYEPPEQHLQRQVDAAIVRRAVQALRPGGLKELLVIPPAGSAPASWPDMSGIPEVLVGWYGSSDRALTITQAEAARVACAARVPVVLIETWMQAAQGLPSLPRGRDETLGEVLAGIVVLPGPAAADALARAWAPSAPEPSAHPALEELLACCAAEPTDPAAFLLSTASNLEQALAGRFADPFWLRRLPATLRAAAGELPPPEQRVVARYVERNPALDGRLAEAEWPDAPVTRVGPAHVRALTNGRTLVLGVRVPSDAHATSLVISVASGREQESVTLDLTRPPTALAGEPARGQSQVGGAREVEVAFGHYALAGDPHPGRVIRLGVELTTPSGTHRLAPDSGPAGHASPGGAVVVLR